MVGMIEVSTTSLLLTSLLSIIFGIIVLVVPKTLNYIVAIYFILVGMIGLFSVFM